MKPVLGIIIALALFGSGDGKKQGRSGNAHYKAERFEDAEAAYREGISEVQESGVGAVHAALLNNLGAALYRQGKFEEATAAFGGSVRMSSSREGLVRGSYNAGNAATRNEQLEAALEHYRSALLADPDNQDAKFNYEFVKRQLDRQQQNQDQQQQGDQKNENEQENEQNQNRENQDQQQQDQQQNQQQQDQQQQDQQQQDRRQNPQELSRAEAQRILQALENEEQQLLRQVQKMNARPRRVEKDW